LDEIEKEADCIRQEKENREANLNKLAMEVVQLKSEVVNSDGNEDQHLISQTTRNPETLA
jgi:hypothetical protein